MTALFGLLDKGRATIYPTAERKPEPGTPVLFFYFGGHQSFERGWRIGWIMGDGTWIAKGTRDNFRHPAEMVLHWCGLPPDPTEECAHRFIDGKDCPKCGLGVREHDLRFYTDNEEEA